MMRKPRVGISPCLEEFRHEVRGGIASLLLRHGSSSLHHHAPRFPPQATEH